jgi:hypothetical protein
VDHSRLYSTTNVATAIVTNPENLACVFVLVTVTDYASTLNVAHAQRHLASVTHAHPTQFWMSLLVNVVAELDSDVTLIVTNVLSTESSFVLISRIKPNVSIATPT